MDLGGLTTALGLLRSMRKAAAELILEWKEHDDVPPFIEAVKIVIKSHLDILSAMLPGNFPASRLGDLQRHLHYAERHDFKDILLNDIPDVEEKLEVFLRQGGNLVSKLGFEELLHAIIEESAMPHFRQGHYRVAVVEGVTALFRLIHDITGLNDDGDSLAAKAFASDRPLIQLTEDLKTKTGQSIQRGMMLLCQGAYARFRNPRAHVQAKEIGRIAAAQELVAISRLAAEISKYKEKE